MQYTSPHQEIFTLCRQTAIEVMGEESVFDYLPGKDTAYPFVFIGEQFASDLVLKTAVVGDVFQTIHVYHNDPGRRGTTQRILNDMTRILRTKKHTRTYYIRLSDVQLRMLTDNTTGTPLLHGVLDLEFRFY